MQWILNMNKCEKINTEEHLWLFFTYLKHVASKCVCVAYFTRYEMSVLSSLWKIISILWYMNTKKRFCSKHNLKHVLEVTILIRWCKHVSNSNYFLTETKPNDSDCANGKYISITYYIYNIRFDEVNRYVNSTDRLKYWIKTHTRNKAYTFVRQTHVSSTIVLSVALLSL